MKILKELKEIKLVIVELEVKLRKRKKNRASLYAQKIKTVIILLNTAHDGRPVLMDKENLIKFN